MKHILSVLVENKSGVLSRVTGMISRRGFNIESLTVAPTEDSTMSRLTAIVNADEVGYEQITKQLHKLVSVYKITDLTDEDAIERGDGRSLPGLWPEAARSNWQNRHVEEFEGLDWADSSAHWPPCWSNDLQEGLR